MLGTFFKGLSIIIYPLILLFCLWLTLRKKKYFNSLKENYLQIIINTLVVSILIVAAIVIFFKLEDTIYVFDYAGHWKRALELRSVFENNPDKILTIVYDSMNYKDYSYLPALFNLWGVLINKGMGFFVICSYIGFLLPFIVLIQILYFAYIKNHKWLPVFVILSAYPLYINLFFCKIDSGSLFFILLAIMLVIIPNFEEIDNIDNISINLLAFISIFFRRWYLYAVIMIYLCYFVKYLIHFKKKIFSKEGLIALLKIISSGLFILCVILLFFKPFFISVLTNNFSEAYGIYNHDGKLYSYLNNISSLIVIISLLGLYSLFKNNKELTIYLLLMSIIPAILISRIQTMEYHHYYSIITSIIILYTLGLMEIFKLKYTHIPVIIFGTLQVVLIFFGSFNSMPLMTNIRKKPDVMLYKQDIIDLAEFLNIQTEGFRNVYLASGNYAFNDDSIRNSFLPEIDNIPNICFATLDLRDGFPANFGEIEFIVVNDPVLFTNEEYQHIYHIITEAITTHPEISKIYKPIRYQHVDEINVTVYEKIGEYTPKMKQYFYNQMISYYPDKIDFFKYILD